MVYCLLILMQVFYVLPMDLEVRNVWVVIVPTQPFLKPINNPGIPNLSDNRLNTSNSTIYIIPAINDAWNNQDGNQ
jgi:hypothetical protein